MSTHQPQQPPIRTEQHGNQVLHVRGDSDSDMEALFSVLRNKNTGSSLKNRNLPASFFHPPEPRPVPCPAGYQSVCGHRAGFHDRHQAGGLAVFGCCSAHGRSVSSPAQLAQYSLQKGTQSSCNTAQQQHNKQESLDGEMMDEYCVNWETCPRYYLNDNTTPWQHEHEQHQQQHQQKQQQQMENVHGQQGHAAMYPQHLLNSVHSPHHPSSGEFSQNPYSLPPGWEQGITSEDEVYFINHVDKTTSWYDPRMSARQMQQMNIARMNQQQQQQHIQNSQKQHLVQPQQQNEQQNICSNTIHPHNFHHSGRRLLPNEQYLCLELQKVHKEKERLQHEQEAIACRELLLNELVRQSATSPSHESSGSMGGMVSGHQAGGGDSFVCGQGSAMTPVDSHVRQNSTDSGLGGMGTTYSLPRSPEDYLCNVDEMDTEITSNCAKHASNVCNYGGEMLGGGTHPLHMTGGACLNNATTMNNDHIVSSLGEDITQVLLSDLDMQKISMMWM